jgi:hypothetical protein
VIATDSCGGYDTISNVARNLRLEVESAADLTNRLTWNRYFEFGGFVDKYEIYRKPNDRVALSL